MPASVKSQEVTTIELRIVGHHLLAVTGRSMGRGRGLASVGHVLSLHLGGGHMRAHFVISV